MNNNMNIIKYFLQTYFTEDCDIEEIPYIVKDFAEVEDKKNVQNLRKEIHSFILADNITEASVIFSKFGNRTFTLPSDTQALLELLNLLNSELEKYA